MARQNLDGIREALLRLPIASRADLQSEWRRLYHNDPPARVSRQLLIAAVGYRLQEQAGGGLRPELARRLRNIAEQVRRGEQPELTGVPPLKPGTRLLREWQGRTHEVVVSDNGFIWQQRRYRSLSAIARAITGTPWSGPVFFGLKHRGVPKADSVQGAGDDAH